MRILWFTGVQLPALTGNGLTRASWQEGLRKELEKNHPEVELAIASFGSEDYAPFQQGNTFYYNIFRAPKKYTGVYRAVLNNWKHFRFDRSEITRYLEIAHDYKPDAVMFYGSENPFGLACEQLDCPSLLNIQGIVNAIVDHMFDGLTYSEFLYLLFSRNMLKGSGSIHKWWNRKLIARIERRVFRLCKNFSGRTAWDRHQIEVLHPGARYFHCDEILSEPYYAAKWTPDIKPETIIFSTSNDAFFKGPVTLVRAIAELKKRGRRNFKLRIAGVSANTEPGKVIQKINNEKQLDDYVDLLGRVPTETIIQEMKRATLFVLASHIENSSNSLAEAMMMGIPCVASDAGGTTSMVEDGASGLIYPHKDHEALADRIEQILDNPSDASKLGRVARETALRRHDPVKISDTMVDIYKNIMISK
jgi:glycosyltransferase involved in cell wall biosynthesis